MKHTGTKHRAAFHNIVGHDLRYAMLVSWGKYIVLFLITVLIIMQFLKSIQFGQTSMLKRNGIAGGVLYSASVGDITAYLFQGMEVYIPSPGNPFQLPIIWTFLNLMFAYIAGDVNANLLGSRYMEFILAQDKSRWWAGKCLATVQSVLLGYLTVYLCTWCAVPFGVRPTYAVSAKLLPFWCKAPLTKCTPVQLTIIFLLLPIFTSVSISILQTVLALYVKPVMGYAIIVAILVASLFYCSFLLPGNGLLPLRSAFLQFGGNIVPWQMCVTDFVLIAACYIIGAGKIHRMDLLSET